MSERLMELRKTLTHACDLDEHDQEWIDIIDRLAAIERQVLWRTEDMPEGANLWVKDLDFHQGSGCVFEVPQGKHRLSAELVEAPDYRPDEEGPIWLPILDPPDRP